jgi:hypothetical protein
VGKEQVSAQQQRGQQQQLFHKNGSLSSAKQGMLIGTA